MARRRKSTHPRAKCARIFAGRKYTFATETALRYYRHPRPVNVCSMIKQNAGTFDWRDVRAIRRMRVGGAITYEAGVLIRVK